MSQNENKLPVVAYVFLCAGSFACMGIFGSYFSRDLPEGKISGASFGVVICFLILAFYFGGVVFKRCVIDNDPYS